MYPLHWWVWIVAAGVLGWAELHLPGSYLMWVALGAAVTGVVSLVVALSLEAQIGVFAAASALSCVAGYFVYRAIDTRRRSDPGLNDRTRELIGARGTVCEAVINGQGKVRLGDGVWLASGPDLAEGTPVVVTAARGTRVTIKPVPTPAHTVA